MHDEKQPAQASPSAEELLEAKKYVRNLKGFYAHLILFIVAILCMALINLLFTPGYFWVLWAALGWGIGLLSHALRVFDVASALKIPSLFGEDWEKRQIEKRLSRQKRSNRA